MLENLIGKKPEGQRVDATGLQRFANGGEARVGGSAPAVAGRTGRAAQLAAQRADEPQTESRAMLERLDAATPVERAVFESTGMEPGLDRAMMLPFAGSREEGNLQLAAPGFVYDAARAFVTPGMAARGQQVSDEDILNTAMNVMGGGVGASRVAGPRTAPDEMLLGMGVGSRDTPTAADDLAALTERAPTTSSIAARSANVVTALNKSGDPLGINIAVDSRNGTDYADLIVSGAKKFESRETASLKPYVGKRVGIVRTGAGQAEVIGSVKIGQPIEVNEKQFNQLRDQHLVAEDSSFNIKKGQTKFLYPMIDPTSTPPQKVTSKGIVARAIPTGQRAADDLAELTANGLTTSLANPSATGGTLGDALSQLNITPQRVEKWRSSREGMRQEKVSQVQQAAEELRAGNISTEEYQRTVRQYQPIKPLGAVQKMPTVEEVAMALGKNAETSPGIVGVNVDLPDGTRVASRLDIPAYDKYDTWVVSLHDGNKTGGNAIGYGQAAVLNDVNFMSSAKAALNIATGKSAKGTIARIYGNWENRDPSAIAQQARDILSGKAPDASDWIEVGMNPYRHSYFYRKSDGMPVASAEQVIQVGPLVLAKKPVTRPVESPEHQIDTPMGTRYFKKGGNVERVRNDNRRYL
jgi:hypothetical protein